MKADGLIWVVFGFLFILVLVQCVQAAPPPPQVAAFGGLPTSGPAPLAVTFTDQSTGSPTGWAWYFGDETYTEPWTQQTASPGWSARYAHTSVVMPDGSIVLMGGLNQKGGVMNYYNDVWRSTDDGATWTQQTASAGWAARFGSSSVVMPDGSIVLMGGATSSGVVNDVWRSTDDGATWTQQTASAGWSARFYQSGVVMPDGSIVLMGGATSSGNVNDVWRSTDEGKTWTQLTASAGWMARYLQNSVVMPDGSIVLMGGTYNSGDKNDVWRSTDEGATWTQQTATAGWSARYGHTSLVMPDSSILLMGGQGYGNTYYNDVWRSTDEGKTWTEVNANAWPARCAHTSVAMPDGSIVLTGGANTIISGFALNDVWRLNPVGSSAQSPSHTYTTSGSYQVSLQVYNAGGYTSTRSPGYILVSAAGAAPTFVSAATNTAGTVVNITFSKTMSTSAVGTPKDYTVTVGGNPDTVTGVALDGTNPAMIDLTLTTLAIYGQTVTVAYTGTDVTSEDGGILGPFTAQQVTNNVPVPVQTPTPVITTPVYTTATSVSGTSTTPGASIVLSVNGVAQPAVTADPTTGAWTVNGLTLAAGKTISVTAQVTGDTVSSAATATVEQAATTTTVTSSENPSTIGDLVTFTATVIPSTATGTIDFVIDGTDEGPVTLSGGSATFATSGLTVGTHTIEANYSGDTNDAASSGILSQGQTVNPIQSSTDVTSSENPSTLDDTVTFTAIVTPSTTTGTVQFIIDGSPFGSPVTLSDGSATSGGISTLTVGSHTVEADYSGDTNDAASIGTLTPVQTVTPLSTSTSVSSSLNPSTYGQGVTVTATVTPSTAGGTVQFIIDGSPFGSPVTVSGGSATSGSIATLIAGTHTVEADYSGDTNDAASIGTLTPVQTVTPASTSTGLASSKNPSTYGDTVTFTATVTPGTATGTVQFKIDGSAFGSPVMVSGGSATSGGISTLPVGTHTIEADYSGDTNHAASSWTLSQTVLKASSTVTLSSSVNPSVYGQSVTFTAKVTPATATGTVTFKDGKRTLGTAALAGGTATFTTPATPPLIVGIHSITAVYGGDANSAKSTSPALIQMVNKAPTTTTVSSSLNPSVYGQSVILTASVSVNPPGAKTLRGTVTFFDGKTYLETAFVSKPRIAVNFLSAGAHSITAVYSGDIDFAASTSPALTQTVNKVPTTTVLSSLPNPSVSGQPVTFTAIVMPRAATGTVIFKDGTTTLGTVNIDRGMAEDTTSALGVGSHSITATYSGNTNYATSTSSILIQTVTANRRH